MYKSKYKCVGCGQEYETITRVKLSTSRKKWCYDCNRVITKYRYKKMRLKAKGQPVDNFNVIGLALHEIEAKKMLSYPKFIEIFHNTDHPRGDNHRWAKLTEKEVAEIRRIGKKIHQVELAKKYNVSQSVISRVLNNKIWS